MPASPGALRGCLPHEHALAVTLWIDDPRALARMAPDVVADLDTQSVAGDRQSAGGSRRSPRTVPADVVVETFGCGVPESYATAMAQRSPPPVWFVLEYLSAEPWIDGSHGLPSPHPRLPLARRFWFPGFTPTSGGLLRERGLVEARTRFSTTHARPPSSGHRSRCRRLLPASVASRSSVIPARRSRRCSMHGPMATKRSTCIVPDGVATGALDAWSGGNVPHPGRPLARGRLALHAIPFLAQERYDRLLWACDVNFVRGEDSFVRAQWAARPFVWHIYPQADDAHLRKLDAFVDRYAASLGGLANDALRPMFRAWNAGAPDEGVDSAWRAFAAAQPALEAHAKRWAGQLATLPELASGLVKAAADGL